MNVGRVRVRGSWISALLKLEREGDVTGDRSSCTQAAGWVKEVGCDATWNIIECRCGYVSVYVLGGDDDGIGPDCSGSYIRRYHNGGSQPWNKAVTDFDSPRALTTLSRSSCGLMPPVTKEHLNLVTTRGILKYTKLECWTLRYGYGHIVRIVDYRRELYPYETQGQLLSVYGSGSRTMQHYCSTSAIVF